MANCVFYAGKIGGSRLLVLAKDNAESGKRCLGQLEEAEHKRAAGMHKHGKLFAIIRNILSNYKVTGVIQWLQNGCIKMYPGKYATEKRKGKLVRGRVTRNGSSFSHNASHSQQLIWETD